MCVSVVRLGQVHIQGGQVEAPVVAGALSADIKESDKGKERGRHTSFMKGSAR